MDNIRTSTPKAKYQKNLFHIRKKNSILIKPESKEHII